MEIVEMIFIIDEKKKRYLIIGFINTIFGYFIGILNYILFYKIIGIFFLSLLNNIVSITFSFLTYKYFVFKTNNNYILKEYFKSYIVYGISFLFSTLILWYSLEIIFLNIYIAQFLAIIATIVFSYIGHNYFTFRNN
tara:strand:+ start:287 stop:697 length:411 start_codon:yes stop_codon:yes gene_type:complete